MKGYLSFSLPEEREEFETAQQGSGFKFALQDYDNWLRNLAKYEDKETVTIEEAREKLFEILGELSIWS